MHDECYYCHTKTVQKLIEKFGSNDSEATKFKNNVENLLTKYQDELNPYIATLIHREAKTLFQHQDLYAEEKNFANQLFLNQYEKLKEMVNHSSNPLYMAAKLAVAGNIIDYGAHSVSDNIEQQIQSILEQDFAYDYTPVLFKQIKEADSILYLGDNAGEIVFDKLFIETMKHPNVTFVVRGNPIINDVTHEDAEQCGMHEVCNKVITNGNDAPSTLLEHCSEEFLNEFENVDLIISKGQGNFEGLLNSKRENLFFMLMAKCDPIAELLGVKKGDLMIKKHKN